MPLLEGLDGVNKMSKSLGNYVGINEPPEQIFGKLMSISDELMWRYIELLSFESMTTIGKWKAEVAAGRNPTRHQGRRSRRRSSRASTIAAAAEKALADFEARFKQGAMPEDMPECTLSTDGGSDPAYQVLKQAGLTASTSEAMRMIEQGGVKLDGEKVSDKGLKLAQGQQFVMQVGKRKFARVQARPDDSALGFRAAARRNRLFWLWKILDKVLDPRSRSV